MLFLLFSCGYKYLSVYSRYLEVCCVQLPPTLEVRAGNDVITHLNMFHLKKSQKQQVEFHDLPK